MFRKDPKRFQLPRGGGGRMLKSEDSSLVQLVLSKLCAQMHSLKTLLLLLLLSIGVHPPPVGGSGRAESLAHRGHQNHERLVRSYLAPQLFSAVAREEIGSQDEIESG
eukprot:5438412-Pyramimonas_sp.AAC.1